MSLEITTFWLLRHFLLPGVSEIAHDLDRVSEIAQDLARVSEIAQDLARVSEIAQDLARVSEIAQDLANCVPVQHCPKFLSRKGTAIE